ncbi:MAG: hypothetical protein RLZZ558_303 [Planctomycetota bacterium]
MYRLFRMGRRRLGLATLAVFMLSSMRALPTPATVARWLGTQLERHPCEQCGCGCVSARQCWTACCCHTPEQRLAWAIREGVSPPADLRFTPAQWIVAANSVKPGSASCGSCVAGIQDRLAGGAGTGCQEATSDQAAEGACLSALGCRGAVSMFVLAVLPALPEPVLVADCPRPAVAFQWPSSWQVPASPVEDLPDPPPRLA